MPTEIRQTDDQANRTTTLLVDGEMLLEDAELVEKIASGIQEETGNRVIIDLADLDLLDSDAATVLRRLAAQDEIAIEGIEHFVQSAVNLAERVEDAT